MKSWMRTALYFAATVIITACISIAATIMITNSQHGERVVLSSEEYQAYHALSPILELMEKIRQEHYGGAVSDEQLIKGALDGVIKSLGDEYAHYYSEEEYTAYLEQLDGSYRGIGALVGQAQQSGVPVLKVYSKSPAEEAGLLAGDLIVSVDGVKLLNLPLDKVEALFSGEEGSSINLEVLREQQTLSFNITRVSGTVKQIVHKLFLQRTGYIQIDKFTGTAAEEFHEALRDLTDRGMRCLVIDLRNNPGGELRQVVEMVGRLLDEQLIVTVRAANGKTDTYTADAGSISVPLAVLVNENSASASEIFAAAIQDNGRGIIVGTQTYGKGVVQTTMQLKSNHGWAKMTTAAYYTPSGKNIHGTGVTPDIDVDLAADIKSMPIDQIEQDDDAQLWEALDYIRAEADALDTNISFPDPETGEAGGSAPDEEDPAA